eukprot:11283125-Alexandrium_andersonii.AAC.1
MRQRGRFVTAVQSTSVRKALGTWARKVAARPLVAGSLTPATATAEVGSSGSPCLVSGTPQKVAKEISPPGDFQGNRKAVSAAAL